MYAGRIRYCKSVTVGTLHIGLLYKSIQVYVQVRIDRKVKNMKNDNKENPKHIIARVLTKQGTNQKVKAEFEVSKS